MWVSGLQLASNYTPRIAMSTSVQQEQLPSDLEALRWSLAALGDRWSLLVVASLMQGPLRFGELDERLTGIAPNILAARLRSLEQLGIVMAEPYSRRPQRFLYELTALGQELSGPLRLLADWGARHGEGHPDAGPSHRPCGTPLEVRWYCPTCEVALDADEERGEAAESLYYA
jgi:DNA-binding HxlR family transcriptional regulator